MLYSQSKTDKKGLVAQLSICNAESKVYKASSSARDSNRIKKEISNNIKISGDPNS